MKNITKVKAGDRLIKDLQQGRALKGKYLYVKDEKILTIVLPFLREVLILHKLSNLFAYPLLIFIGLIFFVHIKSPNFLKFLRVIFFGFIIIFI